MYRKLNRVILLLIVILLVTIFSYFILNKSTIDKNNIITESFNNKNYITCVHYPKTNIKKFDKRIKKYIHSELNYFNENYGDSDYLIDRDEINIDYKYFVHSNRYISLSLFSYINSYKLVNPINKVNSYFYDTKMDKYLILDDVLENIESIYNYVRDLLLSKYSDYIIIDNLDDIFNLDKLRKLYFYIDNNYLYLYLNPLELQSDYYDVLTIKVPLNKCKLKIKINKGKKHITSDYTSTVNKVIDPTKKVVALTFDDGPSIYTIDIINTLRELDACATFFVLGNKVEAYIDTLKLSLKYGNELGNHSYNHKWLSRLSITGFIDQIEKTQNIIKSNLDYLPLYLRPTYGSVNNRMRKNTDLKIILWNVDTKDWKIKNVDRIVEKATTNIKDGDIILMHDVYKRTSKALIKIIPILKEQGFQFVTISELEEIKLLRSEIKS